MIDDGHGRAAHVTLSVPAVSAYASVLRTTAAGLAARLDFTVDDIEDLRIAIGEASALLLEVAAPDTDLSTTFALLDQQLDVQMTVTSTGSTGIDTDSFAWQVLSTLAERCEQSSGDGTVSLSLGARSSLAD